MSSLLMLSLLLSARPLKLAVEWADAGALRITMRNLSSQPVTVWKLGSSFHDDSFQVEARVGRIWVLVKRRPIHWKQNAPVIETLGAGQGASFLLAATEFSLPSACSGLRVRYLAKGYPAGGNLSSAVLYPKPVMSGFLAVSSRRE